MRAPSGYWHWARAIHGFTSLPLILFELLYVRPCVIVLLESRCLGLFGLWLYVSPLCAEF